MKTMLASAMKLLGVLSVPVLLASQATAQCADENACASDEPQSAAAQAAERALKDEFTGFTIDNTITRLGHDFAREVANFRNANYPNGDYNITVFERPSAASGSQIWIQYDFRILFQSVLQPSTDLQDLAQRIVPAIENAVQQSRMLSLIGDQDLAPPEI